MGMTASLRMGLAVLAYGMASACVSSSTEDGDNDCVSGYHSVASAPTWDGLKDAMLNHKEERQVASSLRTQARGDDVDGVGDKDVVRVVDILNRRGRRLVQVDVWRTEAGDWRAGVWGQCTD
jgi:hypothetical protein